MCYLIPVYDWEVKGKEKQQPTIDKKVLQRFVPKYIKQFKNFGYNPKEFFIFEEKRFLKKDEAIKKFTREFIGKNNKVSVRIGDKVRIKNAPQKKL